MCVVITAVHEMVEQTLKFPATFHHLNVLFNFSVGIIKFPMKLYDTVAAEVVQIL